MALKLWTKRLQVVHVFDFSEWQGLWIVALMVLALTGAEALNLSRSTRQIAHFSNVLQRFMYIAIL